MNERYKVIKKLYPNYLIYIKHKGKYVNIGIDKLIIDNFDISETNNIYLNNLDIESKEIYIDNNYKLLENKIRLICIVNKLFRKKDNL